MGRKKNKFIGKSLDKIYEELQSKGIRGFNVEQYDGKDIYNHMYKDRNLYSKQGIMPESMFTDKLMSNCKDFEYKKVDDLLETKDFIYLNFEYKVDDELQEAKKADKKASNTINKAEESIDSYKKDIEKAEKQLKELKKEKDKIRKQISRATDDKIKSMKQKILDNINDKINKQDSIIKTSKVEIAKHENYITKAQDKSTKAKEVIDNVKTGAIELSENVSTDDIRRTLYKEGITIRREDGVYFYKNISQTSSKSRTGKTLWALDKVEDADGKLIRNGVYNAKEIDSLKIWNEAVENNEVFDIASYDAYNSLTQSAITDGYMKINPDNILVVDDLDCEITVDGMVETLDEAGNVVLKRDKKHITKNTLWDGMCLVDKDKFTGDNSFALLRNDMFKSGATKTDLKGLLKARCEKYGLDYENGYVNDKYGNKIRIKDIEMITTNNSTKFDKFAGANEAEMFEKWKKEVKANDNLFAVVKTEHASKFGEVQQLSYQVFNSYDLADTADEAKEVVKKIVQYDIDYINTMKDDNSVFLDYLEKTANEMNSNKRIVDVCKRNSDYMNTKSFKDFKKEAIRSYKTNVEAGKVKMVGDNLILVGDPIMLADYSLGQVPIKQSEVNKNKLVLDVDNYDNELFSNKSVGRNKIYTTKFGHREEVVMSRSPHCGDFSLVAGYNTYDINNISDIEKYIYINDNIAIVDMREYAFQDMTGGSDLDSDFCFVTNNNEVNRVVSERSWGKKPVPVNEISNEKVKYKATLADKAEKDIKVAESKIGWVSNQGQVAQSQLQNKRFEYNSLVDKTSKEAKQLKSEIDELEEIVYRLKNAQDICIDNAKRQSALVIFGADGELENVKRMDCWDKTKKGIVKPKFMNKNAEKELLDNMSLLNEVVENNCKIAERNNTKVDIADLLEDFDNKDYDRNRLNRLISGNDNKLKNGKISHRDGIEDINNRILNNRSKLNAKNVSVDTDEINELIRQDKASIKSLVDRTKLNEADYYKLISDCYNKKYDGSVANEILNALYQKDKNKFLNCHKEGVKAPSSSELEEIIEDGIISIHKQSNNIIVECNNIIDKAIKDIDSEVNKIFDVIRNKENKLTEKEIRALLNERVDLANYKARISRYEAVKECIKKNTQLMSEQLTETQQELYKNAIKEGYYTNMYSIDKKFGFNLSFGLLTDEDITKILNAKFLDSTFYKRIQDNCGVFQDVVDETIKSGLLSGKSLWKISKELEENSHYKKKACERLVRTEVSHFYNDGVLESYKECEIEQYRILATLDNRTSDKCRDMDGRVFNVDEAKQGVNMPPLHCWCRSTTIGVYDYNIYTKKRRARNNEGKGEMIDYKTYKEWYADKVNE